MSLDVDWEAFEKEAEEKAVSGRLPPTWKPQKEGDKLKGIVVEIIPNPWEPSERSYIIRTPNAEEYMTPRNKVLTSLLNRLNPEVGDLIYIRYDGLGKARPGRNPPKIFTVYVKKPGQPDVQPSGPPPAQPSQLQQVKPEELPPVESAEQIEEKPEEKKAADPEVIRKYVLTLPNIYGNHIVKTKFENLLKAKGWNLTAKDVANMLPDVVELTKYGVKIKTP